MNLPSTTPYRWGVELYSLGGTTERHLFTSKVLAESFAKMRCEQGCFDWRIFPLLEDPFVKAERKYLDAVYAKNDWEEIAVAGDSDYDSMEANLSDDVNNAFLELLVARAKARK